MAEFQDTRDAYRGARQAAGQADAAFFAAQERARRLQERLDALDRTFNPHDERRRQERAQLAKELETAQARAGRLQGELKQARAAQVEWAATFAHFSDPREAIAQLNDRIPILLMPVRLETRFKTSGAERAAAARSQLWLRIYPDDCSIDTFEEMLSETEVKNARTYYAALWEAGGIEDQERGAWRGLVAAHGAGRAGWILDHYAPLNAADLPAKALPTNLILVVASETPLSPAEQAAAAAYWRAVWLAAGSLAGLKPAFDALVAATDPARAAEIVAGYRPVNFDRKPASPLRRDQVGLSVAFITFPSADDLELKRKSWSRPPSASLLPDRFVFIGLNAGAAPHVIIGGPVETPLIVGPDPAAPDGEQLRQDDAGELIIPDAMQWIVDFERAVEAGMGMRIDLTPAEAANGFDRVIVVGLRLSADEKQAKAELETLLTHHRYGRSGLSIVPQGTPTNNTETGSAPSQGGSSADESFDLRRSTAAFTPQFDWLDKRDGQWAAEYLGIDPNVLHGVAGSDGRDQADARAMNRALWPATLGYWTESMLSPVIPPDAVDLVRDFFGSYVSGRGAVPALRIGKQPYGILPATALSRLNWLAPNEDLLVRRRRPTVLPALYNVLRLMDADWRRLADGVAYAGKSGIDPQQGLLDILGLHPGSAEYYQRHSESIEDLYNRLNLFRLGSFVTAAWVAAFQQAGIDLLRRLGYGGAEMPLLLRQVYHGAQNLMKGPVIDDRPLSEADPVRAYTTDGRNYLQWLIDAARTSLDAVYAQAGFVDNKPPVALLYLMLRHALQLGYFDTSLRLHESAGLLDAPALVAARQDSPFNFIAAQPQGLQSRYQMLYKTEPAITASPTVNIGDYIARSLDLFGARYLSSQLDALERLKDASTARLERAFAEHIDLCTYRLDAWLLGLVNYQLGLMRDLADGSDAQPQAGIYLGAYAWLENLRPERRTLQPPRLADPDLVKTFESGDEPPLLIDGNNEGYIHAPGLNQAVAAAVLRNGFLSDASPDNRQTLAVNLTSERVRVALGFLEGVREGQSLGALLGYQFERGLHDRYALAEVDKFIYKIRKAFPLRADSIASTATPEGVSIESIEARNVMDGLKLVQHIKATGDANYPWGKPLPAATTAEQAAIQAEVQRMLDSHDAVADLALSEGVYQAVVGNYDRVASTYDAYSRGNFPPEPQVIRTPVTGIGLTHRIGLHLTPGLAPNASPVPGLAMSPRASAEPALNAWLAGVLPALGDVACTVDYVEAATGASRTAEVTLHDLGLQPLDVLHIVGDRPDQAMSELDDRIVSRVIAMAAPRPYAPMKINYMGKQATPCSMFEVLPLVRHLRRIVLRARPLRPTDLTLANEASSGHDTAVSVDPNRITTVRGALATLRVDLAAFRSPLAALTADRDANRAALIAGADATASQLEALLDRAARFVMPQAGWGFLYDFRARIFSRVLRKAADLAATWTRRLADFDALIVEYNALPATASDEQRFALLGRAEGLIAAQPTNPLPALPDDYRDDLVNPRRPAFAARLAGFEALQQTTRTDVAGLLADADALLPVSAFDPAPFSFEDEKTEAVLIAEDAVSVSQVLIAEADRRLAGSQARLDEAAAAANTDQKAAARQAAAKALLGEDFTIIPEFMLRPDNADELEQAWNYSASSGLLDYLENTAGIDFPVDTWLYGVARVREKLHSWEQVLMLAGAFGRAEPALTPLQLPFLPGDPWLALDVPSTVRKDVDRLLYTASFPAPFAKNAPQCGLLLDEWQELIPGDSVDTGIVFHHDRPNNEAAQAMLLVTPSSFRGAWQWADLVDALSETLDFAKRRSVEPVHLESTPYARFLPATVTAVTMRQLTISASYAFNNLAQVRRP
jgi:hypothetical protein